MISYYTWFLFVRVEVCVFVCTCVLSACHCQYILLILSPGRVEIVSSRISYVKIEFNFLRGVPIIQVLQFEPTNAQDFIKIAAMLQHTSSYIFWALLPHHR